MMHPIVVIAVAAAAFHQRPPICRSIQYAIIGAVSIILFACVQMYLVVCRIGCQISLSRVHESSVEYVERYFV